METQEKEIKQQKSMPFPSESLTEALGFVNKIVESRGEQIIKSKEITLATGIPEGSLPLTLSSACQYGILENIHGSGYRPTTLYSDITAPTFDSDKQIAVFNALSSPVFYKKVLDEFNGKVLPNEKGFVNYLAKFGFKSYAIPKITRAFFENFRPFIDGNNRLRFIQPVKRELGSEPILTSTEEVSSAFESDKPQNFLVAHNVSSGANSFKQPIPLPGGKMIVLEYPKGNMTAEDFDALTAFINFLALSEGIKKRE